ncbi:hypothetical protein [Burkholderia sp. BE12]|nr:hypothetical protein [Burkholderia sp. BE12]
MQQLHKIVRGHAACLISAAFLMIAVSISPKALAGLSTVTAFGGT